MKKFLAIAFSVLALTGVALAEGGDESGSASQPATAFVRVPITVIGFQPMLLGDIERGMTNESVQQHAGFKVIADEGDLINVSVNGGQDILLNALHSVVSSEQPSTNGPDDYINDVNGQPDVLSSQIWVTPALMYRFVDDDFDNAVIWDLPTWTARPGYCDTQVDGYHCIPDSPPPAGVGPGMGQINVYVGGTFSTTEDQQRGAYEGDVVLEASYEVLGEEA
ncbi:MAG: hypothetical protein H7X80_00735 [bacterium]|nr:hypothetical protein [Candidatus Kapabacteria bacterium]